MAEDPTLIQTLVNMIISGCQMNGNVFTLMGKGIPHFQVSGASVIIVVDDGTYTIDVTYDGPPITLEKRPVQP